MVTDCSYKQIDGSFGSCLSFQQPSTESAHRASQLQVRPRRFRQLSVYNIIFAVYALLGFGLTPSVQAQNYNPNNYDTANIVQEIKHPHSDLVLLSAHRGLHSTFGLGGFYPENSLQSIGDAAQSGIEIIEVDIKLTSDGVPILTHDATWGRETLCPGCDSSNAFNPFGAQTPEQQSKNPQVSSLNVNQTKQYTLWTVVNQGDPRAGIPTLQDVLTYISTNKIAAVLALDIKDNTTAQICWSIIKANSDFMGRPYSQSVLFKMPATVYPTPSSFQQAFGGDWQSVLFWPYYGTASIAPSTGFGSEANIISSLQSFQASNVQLVGTEVNLKQPGGILTTLLAAAKVSNGAVASVGSFNPTAEYSNPLSPGAQFFNFGGPNAGYCCYVLSDLFYNGGPYGQPSDTADDRGDLSFLIGNGDNVITTDKVLGAASTLAAQGKRNITYLQSDSASGGGRSAPPPPAGGTDGKFLNHAALLGSLPDQDWLFANIPFLDVPDTQIQQVYYYRWHVFKEHLHYTSAAYGWLSTEFLNPVSYGAPYGGIDAAAGHQTIEGRWVRDQDYMKDNINYWLNGPGQFPKPQDFNDNPDTSDWAHEYSYWAATSVWQWFLATGDAPFATGLLPQLVKQYRGWDNHFNPGLGLYWQFPVWDATEYSPASFESSDPYHGGAGYRPTINSYQFGDARAIAQLAAISGDSATASEYQGRASALQAAVQQYLWDPGRNFYYHMNRDNNPSNTLLDTREEEGFVPWMFELPPNNAEAGAFQELLDPDGFSSAYGPPTAERRSRWFMYQAATCCHWDGPSWPFETSQTLTGLANQLIDYPPQSSISAEDYYNLLHTYAATQFKNGVPYVAEAHDPDANNWIYDTPNHSEDYNHSTYNDNVLSGLLGLRGQADNSLLISPLVPSSWSYFGVEDVPYHGHDVTVLWDPFGTRYQQGNGLTVFVDQTNVLHQSTLGPVRVDVGNPILQPDPVHVLSQPVALGTYTITNVLTGKLMGVQNEYPFDGAQIQQYADNGSPDHAWSLEDAGNGYYKLRNLASNLVLGVDQESTADSALIKQAHDNGTLDHFWAITDTGGGQLQIQNLNSGLLLGISFESLANSANVVQFHDNGTPDHLWTVQPIPDPRKAVVYTIENANSSKLLAVEGASVADGAQIQQYDDNGTPDHLWALELQASDDVYIVRNLQSGLVLGVDGESKQDNALIKQAQNNGTPDHLWGFRIDSTTSNGSTPQKIINYNSKLLLGVADESLADSADVVQFKDNGTPDHLWSFNGILDPRSHAFFKIVNVNSNKVLGVQSESLADGAQIQQSDDNGTKDQIWQLDDGGYNLYKIHNWASDLTLGVDQESVANSALIKQAHDNGTPDHIWQFIDAGNGQFKILNTNSGLLLGVDQESQSDGANIVQFQDNGTPDHLWRVEVTVLP